MAVAILHVARRSWFRLSGVGRLSSAILTLGSSGSCGKIEGVSVEKRQFVKFEGAFGGGKWDMVQYSYIMRPCGGGRGRGINGHTIGAKQEMYAEEGVIYYHKT